MEKEKFRDIISGRRKGFAAGTGRCVLNIAGAAYGSVIGLRNGLYNGGILKAHSVPVKVISVGNITAGGTGKTPLVAWIVNYLAKKCRPAILTRGYKSRFGISDEATLLAQACPNIPVIVNPNRIKGAKEAVMQGADVLVLDDGFQHRRLARDLDIITIDAMEPFGFGRILPAGLLREPINQIKRADAVVITRADQSTSQMIENIKQTIRKYKPDMPIACSVHRPKFLITASGDKLDLKQMQEKKVFAYCGIGNPEAFLVTLKNLGVTLTGHKIFGDHYNYSKDDIVIINKQALKSDAELIVTTEKDWIKSKQFLNDRDWAYFAYLTVELEFIEGQDIISGLIDRIIRVNKNV